MTLVLAGTGILHLEFVHHFFKHLPGFRAVGLLEVVHNPHLHHDGLQVPAHTWGHRHRLHLHAQAQAASPRPAGTPSPTLCSSRPLRVGNPHPERGGALAKVSAGMDHGLTLAALFPIRVLLLSWESLTLPSRGVGSQHVQPQSPEL